jgi:hypothetical protein
MIVRIDTSVFPDNFFYRCYGRYWSGIEEWNSIGNKPSISFSLVLRYFFDFLKIILQFFKVLNHVMHIRRFFCSNGIEKYSIHAELLRTSNISI